VLTYAPILDMELADCAAMFNTNVLATFALTQVIARRMVARRAGHIIMVTSTAARDVTGSAASIAPAACLVGAGAQLAAGTAKQRHPRLEIAPGMVDTISARTASMKPCWQRSSRAPSRR